MENNLEFIMMVGLPGSGKSHIAKQFGYPIVESDTIREQLFGNEQGDSNVVFAEVHRQTLTHLEQGLSVVLDATNLSYKHRQSFLQKLNRHKGLRKKVVVVATPIEECLENNKNRSRFVPEHIIWNMVKSFHIPVESEGWDEIEIVWNNRKSLDNYSFENFLDTAHNFNQENEHHDFTLGVHLATAGAHLAQDGAEDYLQFAGYLHDCGKPETKTNKTMKGEVTDNFHYYSHEMVGSYKALFFAKVEGFSDSDILKISQLVRFHMRPYFAETPKAIAKLKSQIGDLYEDLQTLHEADVSAH